MAAKGDYSLQGRIRGKAPPAHPGIETEVVRITETEWRHFIILSKEPTGAEFHWCGNFSAQCCGAPECLLCQKAVPQKWRAYIHALEIKPTSQVQVILEVTQTCLVLIEVQNCLQPWRGTQVRLKKTKGGPKGRFVVEVMPRRIDQATLADEKDPMPILEKLWAFNTKKLAKPASNP